MASSRQGRNRLESVLRSLTLPARRFLMPKRCKSRPFRPADEGYCQTLPKKVNRQFAKDFTKSESRGENLEKGFFFEIFLLTNVQEPVFRVDSATRIFVSSVRVERAMIELSQAPARIDVAIPFGMPATSAIAHSVRHARLICITLPGREFWEPLQGRSQKPFPCPVIGQGADGVVLYAKAKVAGTIQEATRGTGPQERALPAAAA